MRCLPKISHLKLASGLQKKLEKNKKNTYFLETISNALSNLVVESIDLTTADVRA